MTRIALRTALLILLLPGAAGIGLAQDTPTDRVRERLVAFDRDHGPGAILAVFRGGHVVHAQAAGMASLEWDVPLTTGTVFNIASVSKQFTAFAIALLESRGALSVDDEIHEHLPELPDFGAPITIRQMLGHTSGLRSLHAIVQLAGWRGDDRRTNEDIWRITLRQRELNFEPGSEYLYCNTGYMLAAMIVERVTGESFADWMRANVFDPLGMTDTSVQDDYDRVYRNTASSYRGDEESGWRPATPYWAYYGSGNIHTTVADLARWAHNFTTGQVGGPEVIARLQERTVLTNGDTLAYALGINVSSIGSIRAISHGGSIGGYRTSFVAFPEIDAGALVFGNGSSMPGSALLPTAADFLPDIRAELNAMGEGESEQGRPEPESEEEPAWTPRPGDLAGFAGRYYSYELDTAYDVIARGDSLVAWHLRHGTIDLDPVEPDAFDSRLARFEFRERDGSPGLFLTNGRARNVWFARQ